MSRDPRMRARAGVGADRVDGEDPVSLPYCGLGDWQGTGDLARRGLFEDVFTGGRDVGDALFGAREQRPL